MGRNGTKVSYEKRFTKLEITQKMILKQVSNHIPTAISDLEDKFTDSIKDLSDKFTKWQISVERQFSAMQIANNKKPSWLIVTIITTLLGIVMFFAGLLFK